MPRLTALPVCVVCVFRGSFSPRTTRNTRNKKPDALASVRLCVCVIQAFAVVLACALAAALAALVAGP
jgi:hypothetical protein